MIDRCPYCGANMGLVGRIHHCIPKAKLSVYKPVTKNVTENVTENATTDKITVTEIPRPRGRPKSLTPLSNAERQRRYRSRQRSKPTSPAPTTPTTK